MKSFYHLLAIVVLMITTGVGMLRCQIDPAGDARLFRYVFDYPDHYINDHTLIRIDSLWHLYFIDGVPIYDHLDDREGFTGFDAPLPYGGGQSLWNTEVDMIGTGGWSRAGNEIRIGHATSPDLLSWTPRDSALGIGPPGSLDGAHVYAPSVIEWQGRYYMIYTGNHTGYYSGENLFLATSTDLYHWTRYQQEPIFSPDSSWAAYIPAGGLKGAGGPWSGRDPHLYHDDRHGFILYYVARLKGDSATPNGTYSCIAAATSPDMIHWTDRGPLVVRRTIDSTQAFHWNHPESPCLVKRGASYYLFWKGGEGTRYLQSDDPLDFRGAKEHFLATSHASEVFDWKEKWYVTSCSRTVDDVSHGRSDRTKGLFLAHIEWEGGLPRVTSLDHTSATAPGVTGLEAGGAGPNSVRRGGSLFVRIEKNGSGEHDLSITDLRGIEIFRDRIASLVDADGTWLVEIPTGGLSPGIYFVRIDLRVVKVVVL